MWWEGVREWSGEESRREAANARVAEESRREAEEEWSGEESRRDDTES